MLRLLLRTSLSALVVLSLFIGLAVALGKTRPLTTVGGFEGCEFPCWYGVSLMEMYGDGQRMIENMITDGYQYQSTKLDSFTTRYYFTAAGQCDVQVTISSEQVEILSITNCPDLWLGDLLRQIGDPVGVSPYRGEYLIYGNADVFVYLHTQTWLTWSTNVTTISFISLGEQTGGAEIFHWQGVMPHRFYCQSQPEWAADTC